MLFIAPVYRFLFLPKKVERSDYPNLDQSQMSDDPNWQRVLCAPTAASDVISHINNPKNTSIPDSQARQLAIELSKDMGTRPLPDSNPGTEPDELINGLEKFLKKQNKKYSFSEWRGWGANSTKRSGFNYVPSYNWLAKQLKKDNELILHVGFYKKNSDGSLSRVSGHFVTCAGYRKSDLSLKILDPAPRASRTPKFTKSITIKQGNLKTNSASIKARGYVQLNELDLDDGADCAVIDGAFAFKPTSC